MTHTMTALMPLDAVAWQHFDAWLARLLIAELRSLGVLTDIGQTYSVASLMATAKIQPRFQRWLHESLTILAQAGHIQWRDNSVTVLSAAESSEVLWQAWAEQQREYEAIPDLTRSVHLVTACLQRLPDILTGRLPATEVLFPESSVANVEHMYQQNAVVDYFNRIVADWLARGVEQRLKTEPKARIRIIEIGAGTGGTTAMVLPALAPFSHAIEEYCYTDISKAFLLHAEQRYGQDAPFLRYHTWNVEQAPTQAGIELGAYDFALATNVLHATQNIRQTLSHVHAVVKQRGLLIINEGIQKSVLGLLTFGLLDGWWRYQDSELRIPGSPLLSPESWQTVLKQQGFSRVVLPKANAQCLGQQVFIAESDGLLKTHHAQTLTKPILESNAKPSEPLILAERNEYARESVIAVIQQALSVTLKLPTHALELDQAFSDYGIDSILGAGFVKHINNALALSMNTAVIFDHSSVLRLADYIVATYKTEPKPSVVESSALNRTKPVVNNAQDANPEHIAIIGMSGQFPGAETVEQFWQNLINGVDAISELPAEYWDFQPVYQGGYQPKQVYRYGGVLKKRACFDAQFFNIAPREAESMNPHQRLILQESWRALEDAGINPKSLDGRNVGLFIGAEPTGYFHESFTGSSDATIAARLAYFLNLTGPALVVNTGCSSSGVALHLACESLRRHDSDMVLAGGVYAGMSQSGLSVLAASGMLSPTGQCHSFDASANGTVLSEGVGVVVLKRLADAEADGDLIAGVIIGSGINQDGASNGMTAPNGAAQQALMESVYQRYQINPESISYIEAHGTATKLGDPVEANALARMFKRYTDKTGFCALGSAKAFIGHTSAAAGVIGLIKILLSMRHKTLPGLLHFQQMNPLLELADSALFVEREPRPLPCPGCGLFTAALNSFGHSGTNAHLVIRQYPELPTASYQNKPVLVPLSAKTPEALQRLMQQLLSFIAQHDDIALTELAYTLQTGRAALPIRRVYRVETVQQLQALLTATLADEPTMNTWYSGAQPVSQPLHWLADDEDSRAMVLQWIRKAKLNKLAELWVQGAAVDWTLFYDAGKPSRLRLPTYPFAETRYWATARVSTQGVIHELVQKNLSDLTAQRYESVFTGMEWFFAQQNQLLPAVLPMMAAIALTQALPSAERGNLLRLYSAQWLTPSVTAERGNEGKTLTIEISAEDGLSCCIFDDNTLFSAYAEVLAQGEMIYVDAEHAVILTDEQTKPAWRSQIELLSQVFASLSDKPVTIQGFDELLWYAPEIKASKACISGHHGHSVNLDLCSVTGQVVLRITGLTYSIALAEPAQCFDGISYLPRWQVCADAEVKQSPAQQVAIIATGASPLVQALSAAYQTHFPQTQVLVSNTEHALTQIEHLDTIYFIAVGETCYHDELVLFRLSQQLKALSNSQQFINLYLIGINHTGFNNQAINPNGAGIIGLGYALAQSEHRFLVRNIDLCADEVNEPELCQLLPEQLWREPVSDRGELIKLYAGRRYHQAFIPVATDTLSVSSFKQRGVYLILGGSGTVGTAVTRYLINEYDADVIWLGRKAANSPAITAKLNTFSAKKPFYVAADVTDLTSLTQALQTVHQIYPVLNGAVFSGLDLTQENSLSQFSEAEFYQQLQLKISGSRHFYQLLQHEALDFLVYFSSGQAFAFSGAAKLPAYATGICYADSYVLSLAQQARFPVGIINWGFWQASFAETGLLSNIAALSDDEGCLAFQRFCAGLARGLLQQCVCMRASEPVRQLMRVNDDVVYPAAYSPTYQFQANVLTAVMPEYEGLAQRWHEFDACLIKLLAVQLHTLGWPARTDTVLPNYQRWLTEAARLLADNGLANLSITPADAWQEWALLSASWQAYSDMRSALALADTCLKNLPSILRGDVEATDILFAKSDVGTVQTMYRENPVVDYFNQALAELVRDYIEQRLAQQPNLRLRLLEIGAGTGGTTLKVLPVLKPFSAHIAEYLYTDVSKTFLTHGEQQFSQDYTFLRCQLLNIEQAPNTQGFALGDYDIVIATNVLHATKDVRQSVFHAKQLLVQNGLLLINENCRKITLSTLTFGLLEGWWRYQDAALRIPGSPLLTEQRWLQVLSEQGLVQPSLPVADAIVFGQQIIMATSDGWLKHNAATTTASPAQRVSSHEKTPSSISQPIRQTVHTNLSIAEQVNEAVLTALATSLKLPKSELTSQQAFSDLGIDSILGVNFVADINQALGLCLNTAIIFDYTTAASLSQYLLKTYPDLLTQRIDFTPPLALNSPTPIKTQALISKTRLTQRKDNDAREQLIAVIGMSARVPGADDITAFWQLLVSGQEGVSELPPEFTGCRRGGLINGKEYFDSLFFMLSPLEANAMHPHQRLVLEQCYLALLDAGINPKHLAGEPAGVFIGAEPTGFFQDSFTGASEAIIASRLAYFLNLKGPALVVNTGCSSSAVAIHLACTSLRTGESRVALAGGVFASLNNAMLTTLAKTEMLSPSGACHSFDAAADGTVFSEGVGIVVLKRLADALADNNPIYGVIHASAVNQDGTSNGITAPNGSAQEALIAECYRQHQIHPEQIRYVEAHGTGTKLGDPVEVNALVRAFKHFTDKAHFCALGSVKAQIGHTSASAGVIGLIKLMLCLKHKQLPGQVGFQQLNPLIELDGSAFYITTNTQAFEDEHALAALNSFGHSGTNAHIVVGAYQPVKSAFKQDGQAFILPVSAKQPESLYELLIKLRDYVNSYQDQLDLADMAYTLQVGREAMTERCVFIANSVTDWLAQLAQVINHGKPLVVQDKMANAWLNGEDVDWRRLYGAKTPHLVNLPGYVFAKQLLKIKSLQTNHSSYPLLRNDSTLSQQSYRIDLTGQEPFFAEHRIQGVAVLPAVMYLEWIHTALTDASRNQLSPTQCFKLRNLLWARPLRAEADIALSLRLVITPISDKQLAFKVISADDESHEYCVGEAEFTERSRLAPLDLKRLQPGFVVSGADCYQRFAELGFSYGSSFQGLAQIQVYADGVLAQLTPAVQSEQPTNGLGSYRLLDSALQALIGFSFNDAESELSTHSPGLPFALATFDCVEPGLTLSQAWLSQQPSPNGSITHYHIAICDEQGRVGIYFQGLSVRQHAATASLRIPSALNVSDINTPSLDAVQHFLRQEIARVLEIQPERIRSDDDWAMYGIDSIIVLQLTRELEKTFGTLAKTLFFEYQSLAQLSAYFAEAYAEKLHQVLGVSEKVADAVHDTRPDTNLVRKGVGLKSLNTALDIAIVGVSGRYPKADDLNQFWCNLRDGVDCISEIPEQRWQWREFYRDDNQPHGSHSSRWGGFINDADCFEPLFFTIAPREAQFMDPQERLFLQQAWQAIEDAGYTPKDLERDGEAGVYAGVMYSEYQLFSRSEAADDTRIGFVGNFAGVANRVSYHLNLHGPSMTVDTMCSSSLSAIHLACQDLHQHRISVALAGGVNLSLHPNKYSMLSGGGFISERGRCHSFGADGDGYIPGEGVGIVVLKRLADALRDGDSIYGVIKSTVINHGGKTQAYSVPNPNAQQRLIRQALAQAGIDADAISYVETHGTGTPLGDPIEIAGLSKAFAEAKQRCAIGSVKSNIGHCEAAAGIAAVTKVLLQLQHGQIVPSLHAQALNPHIDFAATPFVVNQVLSDWQPRFIHGEPQPRTAGISSFGAGGSNAHLIIQEWLAVNTQVTLKQPALIVLSAKDDAHLHTLALNLLKYLREHKQQVDLADLAYTLQVGRVAMAQRLGFIADSVDQVAQVLHAWLDGDASVCSTHSVTSDSLPAPLATLELGPALLTAWLQGLEVDWAGLYDAPRQRLHLPAYPFAGKRYWLPETLSTSAASHYLHPLLQQNMSDLRGYVFQTRLTGAEFFLNAHQLHQQKLLPGAVYLEMVTAAMRQLLPDEQSLIVINELVWLKPLVVAESERLIAVRLVRDDEQRFNFSVLDSHSSEVYCQGRVSLFAPEPSPSIDIAPLIAMAKQHTMTADACYRFFSAQGFVYGSSMQALSELLIGNGQVLARICLPESVQASFAAYYLHPALLDAVFQAAVGFVVTAPETNQPLGLPFALDEAIVYRRFDASLWAWLRPVQQDTPGIQKFAIDCINDQGFVCLSIKGFTSVASVSAKPTQPPTTNLLSGLTIRVPDWRPVNLTRSETGFSRHIVLTTLPLALFNGLDAEVLPIQQTEHSAQQYLTLALSVFNRCRDIMVTRDKQPVLLQLCLADNASTWFYRGLLALLKTAHREHPALIPQLCIVSESLDPDTMVSASHALKQHGVLAEVRLQHGQWLALDWRELDLQPTTALPWQQHGVYLITGGLGGLGLIVARELAQCIPGVRIVLIGRSPADLSKLTDLRALASVDYYQADIADLASVQALAVWLQQQYGQLNGVIHSAGVVRDKLMLRKTEAEFAEVFAPKVNAVLNLEQALQGFDLDFCVYFSSMTSVVGNPGQADYAAANGFIDAYAEHRQHQVQAGLKRGLTVAINWPYWQNGGMQMDAALLNQLREQTGMLPLSDRLGMTALYSIMASGVSQALVWSSVPTEVKPEPVKPEQPELGSEVSARAEAYFQRFVAQLLDLSVHEVKTSEDLASYGINSILVLSATSELEKHFGVLAKTLFFQYRTVRELSAYFMREHQPALLTLLGVATNEVKQAALANSQPVLKTALKTMPKAPQHRALDIAIIGLSGRYPMADDVAEFWQNLRMGRDCISEVPRERWDWREFYSSDRSAWGSHFSRHGGFINGIDEFDALFFNISPREAELIDPQERLLLQQAWLAVEDAGYCRRKPEAEPGSRALPGETGVYVGVMTSEYPLIAVEASALGMAGGSFASIANRVSYILNINGPSLAVDTMCSSSLTAIDLACRDLASGRTKLALAGGVNLSLHPHKYRLLSAGQFISSRGRCESFGAYGEGYIPGEGVGVLVLKPLADAVADGDAIYAVIKGSALNHGGKTNAYSVPNPNAQRQVIQQALSEAGISAEQIAYVEAHGTGTALGDPIEITGLADAFGLNPSLGKTCLIGSVKSNIGHCEAAAGVASVTKVLLQMQQNELVPSLHAQPLNPHIDFAATPFAVNHELTAWTRVMRNGQELPRSAGISSFGAGGANAHLILQDYQAPAQAFTGDMPIIMVLSAKTPERLKVYAEKLLAFVQATEALDLYALAFTLQTGREAMPHRIALIVDNQAELITKLSAWLHSGAIGHQVFVGAYERNPALSLLADDDDIHATVAVWISKRKYEKLLTLWVQGFSLNWLRLYSESTPKRLHAPTYPFAQETYWLPDLPELARHVSPAAVLHPLVHYNQSTFAHYCFGSEFTGAEFFLRDHLVQGVATLPGVAYMEMARVAYGFSAGFSDSSTVVLTLTDLVWLQPFSVKHSSSQITIRLTPDAQQKALVQIVSNDTREVVHSQVWAYPVVTARPDALPLAQLQQHVNQHYFTGEDCYRAFTATGIAYGVGQQSLQQLWVGDNQVLAHLALPRELAHTVNDYGLHPSLMDGVLQASIGYVLAMPENQVSGMTALPFAVDTVVMFAPCTESMWAWLRFAETSQPGDAIQKFDIDVSDANGAICVLIRGFSLRASKLAPQQHSLAMPSADAVQKHSDLAQACQSYLAEIIAEVLKLPMQRLEPDTPLQQYGLDSVMAIAVTNRLEQDLASLPKTLLFDYQTLTELSAYLLNAKAQPLLALLTTATAVVDTVEQDLSRENAYCPLSEGQVGLWWLQHLQPDSGAYNLPMAFSISHNFDQDALLYALSYVLQQHELLRARLAEQNDQPVWVIQQDIKFLLTQLYQHDHVTTLGINDCLPQLKTIAKQAFPLNAPLLWRVQVISDAQQAALVLVTVHHSIFDGRSVALFMADLWQAYQAFRSGEQLNPTPRVSYASFVNWQHAYLASANYLADLTYWQQQLADMPSRLALPIDYCAEDTTAGIGASLEIHLSAELCQAVREFALQQRVSVATVYLTAYAQLLHCYTGQEDIVIAMPTLGRTEPEFENTIGYFINMILLRSRVNDTMTVKMLLQDLHTLLFEGLSHSALPLPRLVRELTITSVTTQLYQASFAYQNFISAHAQSPVPELDVVPGFHQEGADWLSLEIYEQSNHHWLRIDYRSDLFSAETVQSMFTVYQTLLTNMMATPHTPLTSVSLLNEPQRQQVLRLGQGGVAETVASDISELVLLQAQHTPEQIALIVANSKHHGLSYRELSSQVIDLASYLYSLNFPNNSPIGVCVPRGVDVVIAMLALWRVGLVYVPLEPDYPEAALTQTLVDAELVAIITRDNLIALDTIVPIIDLATLGQDEIPTLDTWPVIDINAPAYIIYTSGSTGKPKGVVISRAALSQHCQIMRGHYHLSPDDHILQFSSYHVDTSLEQILPGLLAGATIVLRSDELWTSKQAYQVLSRYDVSVMDLPPAYFYELCRDFTAKPDKLRLIIVGGETLPVATVKVWTQSPLASVTLINAYGPSEATITATTQTLHALDFSQGFPATMAIGKALPGYQVYLLDAQQAPVPEGMVGELYLGGSQLALAYWQRQELTEQRFCLWPVKQQRLYRTGDKARFIPGSGGVIEFLGRIDQQIKLRGFRIEPGEIEAAILRFPGVVTSRVVLHTDLNQHTYLLAIVQTAQTLESASLQAFLHAQLPYYMVPTVYQMVDSLPLTPAGKLDIQGLIPALLPTTENQAKAPSTLNEQRVATIWSEVLGYAVTNVNADFFALGGHSLLALRLLTALNSAFNQTLSLIDLMRQPTIAGQALLLMAEIPASGQGIVELKPGANKLNLFCLPTANGQLIAYQALAACLPEDYSVYGLHTRFIGETLEELAASCVQQIRAQQPLGPYYLLGWSLGGLLAYEIAQQLIKSGATVASLILLDSYLPATLKKLTGTKIASTDKQRLQDFCEDLLHAYDIDCADLIAESNALDDVIEAVLQRLHELTSLAKNELLHLWQYFNPLVNAAESYLAEPYQGQTILLIYAEQPGLTPERLIRDWQDLNANPLVCHGVIAEHHTLLQSPVVKTLAKIISDHVSSSQ